MNITGRKRAEEALRESEERLRAFMESAPDSFSLYDAQLRLVEINRTGLRWFPAGTKKEDIVGKHMLQIAPYIKKTGRYDRYREVVKSGKPFIAKDVVSHPTFGAKHLAVMAFKVGEGMGIMATDITSQKCAEEKLKAYSEDLEKKVRERTRELEQTNKRKADFLTDASHELRTPLTIIKSSLDLLLRQRSRGLNMSDETFAVMGGEIQRLSHTIADLAALAHVDVQKPACLDIQEVRLDHLLTSLAKKCQTLGEKKNITIHLAPLPRTRLWADKRALEKCLMNVVSNAIWHGKKHGWIRMRITQTPSHVTITVRDNGRGIPKRDLPHIFERFYRVDKARTREHGGVGLGLAICKWVVEAHGGTITVTSRYLKGSNFTLQFPRTKPHRA